MIVETGEAREVHHIAVLLGYGATAVNPYLAFETVADLAARSIVSREGKGTLALDNYIAALSKGLLKIMSKMGISTLRSYRGAQVYEAIGLDQKVVDAYFTGTPSRVGGIGLDGIAAEVNARYQAAQDPAPELQRLLPSGGLYGYRKDGERHLWTPETISLLQQAARQNRPELYRDYARKINDQAEKQSTLRGLFRFKEDDPGPARRGGAGRVDHEAVRHLGHVVRLDQPGGARDARDRHEPDRRHEQLRRGGRGPRPLHPAPQRRQPVQRGEAGGERPLRRDDRVPGERARAADQDRPGRQARRRRAASGPQGERGDRKGKALHAGRDADIAPAPP